VTPAHPPSVGILGGTFNPPHLGHLALARCALQSLGLQRVVLMPVHSPPHKPAAGDPGPEHRLRMCELLVRDSPSISACALEIERGGASYTVDTLTQIHASHPDAQLTLIAGADTASTLPAWREPARVLELADLAVAMRAGASSEDVIRAIEPLSPRHAEVVFLDMPVLDASSSAARERCASGEPISDLVGVEVAGYIAAQGLYRAERGGRG
jgi:nicotinate-nucleotide adenylyltransferase